MRFLADQCQTHISYWHSDASNVSLAFKKPRKKTTIHTFHEKWLSFAFLFFFVEICFFRLSFIFSLFLAHTHCSLACLLAQKSLHFIRTYLSFQCMRMYISFTLNNFLLVYYSSAYFLVRSTSERSDAFHTVHLLHLIRCFSCIVSSLCILCFALTLSLPCSLHARVFACSLSLFAF